MHSDIPSLNYNWVCSELAQSARAYHLVGAIHQLTTNNYIPLCVCYAMMDRVDLHVIVVVVVVIIIIIIMPECYVQLA